MYSYSEISLNLSGLLLLHEDTPVDDKKGNRLSTDDLAAKYIHVHWKPQEKAKPAFLSGRESNESSYPRDN